MTAGSSTKPFSASLTASSENAASRVLAFSRGIINDISRHERFDPHQDIMSQIPFQLQDRVVQDRPLRFRGQALFKGRLDLMADAFMDKLT